MLYNITVFENSNPLKPLIFGDPFFFYDADTFRKIVGVYDAKKDINGVLREMVTVDGVYCWISRLPQKVEGKYNFDNGIVEISSGYFGIMRLKTDEINSARTSDFVKRTYSSAVLTIYMDTESGNEFKFGNPLTFKFDNSNTISGMRYYQSVEKLMEDSDILSTVARTMPRMRMRYTATTTTFVPQEITDMLNEEDTTDDEDEEEGDDSL
jgi:hypothetical protein